MPKLIREPITESAGANVRYRYPLDAKPAPRWIADLVDAPRPAGVLDVEVETDPPSVVVTFAHEAAAEVHEWAPALIEST